MVVEILKYRMALAILWQEGDDIMTSKHIGFILLSVSRLRALLQPMGQYLGVFCAKYADFNEGVNPF